MCEEMWKQEFRRIGRLLKGRDMENLIDLPAFAVVHAILERLVQMGCGRAGPLWLAFDQYLDAAARWLVELEATGEITIENGIATSNRRLVS